MANFRKTSSRIVGKVIAGDALRALQNSAVLVGAVKSLAIVNVLYAHLGISSENIIGLTILTKLLDAGESGGRRIVLAVGNGTQTSAVVAGQHKATSAGLASDKISSSGGGHVLVAAVDSGETLGFVTTANVVGIASDDKKLRTFVCGFIIVILTSGNSR